MTNTNIAAENAGDLFNRYPCLNIIWAFTGSDRAEKRSKYVSELLSAAGVSREGIGHLISAGRPYLEPCLNAYGGDAVDRKPCDVLHAAYTELDYVRSGRNILELQFDPCIFCKTACGGRPVQQQAELAEDEFLILAFIMNNAAQLLPSLKKLFTLGSRRKFLKIFRYRKMFFQKETIGSESGVISYPLFCNAFSAVMDIVKAASKKPDEISLLTNQPFLSPVSIFAELLSDGRFSPTLKGAAGDGRLMEKYDYMIRRSLLRAFRDRMVQPVTFGDFMAACDALSSRAKTTSFFCDLEQSTKYAEAFDDVFRAFVARIPDRHAAKEDKNPGAGNPSDYVPTPDYDEIRRQNRTHIDSLGGSVSPGPAGDLPEPPHALQDTESVLPEIPDLALASGPEQPDCGETPGEAAAPEDTVPPHADPPDLQTGGGMFTSEGYLILDSVPRERFTEFEPHLSDSWFAAAGSYDSFSVELAQHTDMRGYLFFGHGGKGTDESPARPMFIPFRDAEQITVNTGMQSLLFDLSHKTYYSYNKAQIICDLMKHWSFAPDTLISGICSLQVMQALVFKDYRLRNPDRLLPLLSSHRAGSPDPLDFFCSYGDLYRISREQLLPEKKNAPNEIRCAEAFEYALATSFDISPYATVDEVNCRRKTWTKADFEYSDFRKIRKRGIQVGFEISVGSDGPGSTDLWYVTLMCIGRCLISQVISKSRPVLLRYGPGRADFFLPSFGDPEKPWIQARLRNAFTAFNVCFKDALTGLGFGNAVLRNLYPLSGQLPD